MSSLPTSPPSRPIPYLHTTLSQMSSLSTLSQIPPYRRYPHYPPYRRCPHSHYPTYIPPYRRYHPIADVLTPTTLPTYHPIADTTLSQILSNHPIADTTLSQMSSLPLPYLHTTLSQIPPYRRYHPIADVLTIHPIADTIQPHYPTTPSQMSSLPTSTPLTPTTLPSYLPTYLPSTHSFPDVHYSDIPHLITFLARVHLNPLKL